MVNALGDRYLLLRLPDVDASAQARAALAQAEHEIAMRADLTEAMTGLIQGADRARVHHPLSERETKTLIALASFAARARTAVERDSRNGDLLVLPQPEGPARLVKALRRLYGALGAIGVDDERRWSVLRRIALDCSPAVRVPVMRLLVATETPQRTAWIADQVGMVPKTVGRLLDDLVLLGIAEHSREGQAVKSPDLWQASSWLRDYWPEVGQRTTTTSHEVG